jgi:hypothetical protein
VHEKISLEGKNFWDGHQQLNTNTTLEFEYKCNDMQNAVVVVGE